MAATNVDCQEMALFRKAAHLGEASNRKRKKNRRGAARCTSSTGKRGGRDYRRIGQSRRLCRMVGKEERPKKLAKRSRGGLQEIGLG